jgi:hypothetical protein
MRYTTFARALAGLMLALIPVAGSPAALAAPSPAVQRLPPTPPPGAVHLILQLTPSGFAIMQGEVTVGQRSLTIWDRSGSAATHTYKIVRISPTGKKKVLFDGRPNEYDNIVTVLTFKPGYVYEVRVKDVSTGAGSKFRLEVPSA